MRRAEERGEKRAAEEGEEGTELIKRERYELGKGRSISMD